MGRAAQVGSEGAIQAAVFVDRAVLAYEEKRYDVALKELDAALRLDAENLDALYYQGLIYAATDRPQDARAAFEKARKLRPGDVDIAFQLGALYFGEKDYAQAEPLLREVYRADSKRPNIGFYLGVIEFNKQNFREALGLFRVNVPSDDEFAKLAHIYTSLTLAQLGSLGEAKAEIDQALRIPSTSPLTTPAQRFGEIIERAQAQQKSFRGELRLGMLYDTNIPVVPDHSGDPTAQASRHDQRRQKSEAEFATLDLAYTWWRTADWESTVSHRFFQTYYNHLTEFNAQSNTPSISVFNRGIMPAVLGGFPYIAGGQVTYDYISLGNRPFTQRWIATPSISISEDDSNVTTVQYRYQWKDFFHDEDFVPRDVRDANNHMIGPTHFVRFEKGRHYVKLGYQYDAEFAQGENWSYRGNRLLTGFQYTLPWWDIRFSYDLDYHWRRYDNRTIFLQPVRILSRRRDQEAVHLTRMAKDVWENFTVAVEYLFDRGASNVALYDYHRHVVMTSVAWRF
jgi:tetratricopeptide (TPR) repeat protein